MYSGQIRYLPSTTTSRHEADGNMYGADLSTGTIVILTAEVVWCSPSFALSLKLSYGAAEPSLVYWKAFVSNSLYVNISPEIKLQNVQLSSDDSYHHNYIKQTEILLRHMYDKSM